MPDNGGDEDMEYWEDGGREYADDEPDYSSDDDE